MKDTRYFDYAATTPVDPVVVEAMRPFWTEVFGNPSSSHSAGRAASRAVEDARSRIASVLNASPDEIIFNSGATEGCNHAVIGAARALKDRGRHICVSAIEHHAVLEPARALQRDGFELSYCPVDEQGRLDVDALKTLLRDDTILVAVIHASNEIGTIQPIGGISALTRERGIPLLVDACQTVGHLPVDTRVLGADFLAFSAHKFYGPKGVGALYVRGATPLEPFMLGGDQERSRRASTLNVAGIVGMARALELCAESMEEESRRQIRSRDRLIDGALHAIAGARLNGSRQDRLPNNINISFDGARGEDLLLSLDMKNFAASTGSACESGQIDPSHVLKAIGLSDEQALGAVRFSVGRWTTDEDVDALLDELPATVRQLRGSV